MTTKIYLKVCQFMKTIIYYLLLLVFIALVAGTLVTGQVDTMGMSQTIGISAALILYAIALSFVGEGKSLDEREVLHRNLSNRAGLIAGLAVLSIGIIVQLFYHRVDYWLLSGLIIINLTKIIF